MAYNFIQMPSVELHNNEDQFSWRLLVFSLNSATKSTALVGNHFTCDFRIASQKFPCILSRKHAFFKISEQKLYVKDLGSSNGTFRNNVMLEPKVDYLVRHGDLIGFGNKSNVKPTPGDLVKAKDTPFLFRVLKIKSFSSASKATDSSVIIISDDEDTISTGNEGSIPKETNLSSVSDFMESENKNSCVNKEIPVSLDDGLSASSHQLRTEYTFSDSVQNRTSEETCLPIYKNSSELKRTNINEQSLNENPKKKRKSIKNQEFETIGDFNDLTIEHCSSETCLVFTMADNSAITWVQCDLCDKWYHTACVGCNYDEVKDLNRQFYCEFCNPNKSRLNI